MYTIKLNLVAEKFRQCTRVGVSCRRPMSRDIRAVNRTSAPEPRRSTLATFFVVIILMIRAALLFVGNCGRFAFSSRPERAISNSCVEGSSQKSRSQANLGHVQLARRERRRRDRPHAAARQGDLCRYTKANLNMAVEAEKIESKGSKVSLRIKVDGETTKAAVDSVLKELGKTATIPGFRKGKVPQNVLVSYFGEKNINASALEEVVNENVKLALQDAKIPYLGNASLTEKPEDVVARFVPGQPLSFDIAVEVWPEANLKDSYKEKEIVVARLPEDDLEELVERTLNDLRQRTSQLREVPNGTIEYGNTAIASIRCYRMLPDGKRGDRIRGVASEDEVNVPIEKGRFLDGFVEGLMGAKAGEVRQIPVRFPDNHKVSKLAGKSMIFEVKIHSIKERILPEVTDEWAKEVTEQENVEQLKDTLRKKLVEENERMRERNMDRAIEDFILDITEVDLPEALIEEQVKRQFAELMAELKSQGVPDNKIKAMITKENYERYRTGPARENAARSLRIGFGISKILESEGLKLDDSEIEKRLQEERELAGSEEFDEKLVRERLVSIMERELAFDFIRKNCSFNFVNSAKPDQSKSSVPAQLAA
jgi:trigger factor